MEVLYGPGRLRDILKKQALNDAPSLNKHLPLPMRIPEEQLKARKSILIEMILTRLALASQVHAGGFLYHRFAECPIIKRDLVYRMQFTIYDVEHCLEQSGDSEMAPMILSEMRRKGTGLQLPLFKRLLFRDGLI